MGNGRLALPLGAGRYLGVCLHGLRGLHGLGGPRGPWPSSHSGGEEGTE